MYCWHDMSKSGICLFNQIVIFILIFICLETSTLRNPRIFNIQIKIDLFWYHFIQEMNSRADLGACNYRFSHYSTFRPQEFLIAQVRFPSKTHSSLFHYGQLSLMNIIRYFYTCTVLKLAIMIFVHFPSYLSKLLPNYVFLDFLVHKKFRKIDIK